MASLWSHNKAQSFQVPFLLAADGCCCCVVLWKLDLAFLLYKALDQNPFRPFTMSCQCATCTSGESRQKRGWGWGPGKGRQQNGRPGSGGSFFLVEGRTPSDSDTSRRTRGCSNLRTVRTRKVKRSATGVSTSARC
ncbi:hypothetical protein QR685DRAFT_594612 [Neurospora intermedia]|uniref:Secreted protein n=1 Tax=Neurospora intermedia TaxID=5142 RepID=A0ABR3DUA6_NEUIN